MDSCFVVPIEAFRYLLAQQGLSFHGLARIRHRPCLLGAGRPCRASVIKNTMAADEKREAGYDLTPAAECKMHAACRLD